MIEIKHKTTGEVLKVVEADTLSCADLRDSDLSFSNLRDSDLSFSDLRFSDLRDSDLSFSNLRGAKGEFMFNWGVKLKVVEEKDE
jgi:uncharacterized protein YjbI with pentapeptide repeats